MPLGITQFHPLLLKLVSEFPDRPRAAAWGGGKRIQRTGGFRRFLPLLAGVWMLSGGSGWATVRLNEVVASNGSTHIDEDGDASDWVELFNRGATPVDLSAWGLSDNENNPFKWSFTPGTVIAPGAYQVIWASGKDRTGPALHTNYSISAAGEPILLTRPNGSQADNLPPTPLTRDVSVGRVEGEGDTWFFFDAPTPGAANTSTPFLGVLDSPGFSHSAGFYNNSFTLSLDTPPGVEVLYTLDGSEPDEANLGGSTYVYKNEYPITGDDPVGPLLERSVETFSYTNPLLIQDRSMEPNGISLITTQFGSNPVVPAEEAFKGTVVRARSVAPGYLPSRVQTATYFVHQEMAERYDLLVLSLSTNEPNLFSYEDGIAVPGAVADAWLETNPEAPARTDASWRVPANYHQRGSEWERAAHLEVFSSAGDRLLAQNIGIRIHGGASRWAPRKSFRIYARSDYDEAYSLDFAFFQGLQTHTVNPVPIESFRRMILRNSGNDHRSTLYRDGLAQGLVAHLDLDQQAYRPVIHFVNGEYWGINNLRERLDAHTLAARHGLREGDIAILENHGVLSAGTSQDLADYQAMLSYARTEDLADSEAFAHVATLMDVENFAAYFAVQIVVGNADWPQNNVAYWRGTTDAFHPNSSRAHDGRWRWMLYDLDQSLGYSGGAASASRNNLARVAQTGSGTAAEWSTALFRSLLKNEGFRHYFINKLADLTSTAFAPHRVHAMVDDFNAAIKSARSEHVARWSNGSNRGDAIKDFAATRPVSMRQHVLEVFGLPGTAELTIVNPAARWGSVKINSILLDAAAVDLFQLETQYPWTGVYFQEVPVSLQAIPEVGYRFLGWRISENHGATTQQNGAQPFASFDPEIQLVLEEDTTVEAVFGSEHFQFLDWVKLQFPDPSDQLDPLLSGPAADPLAEGLPNLVRYALNMNARELNQALPLQIYQDVGGASAILSFPRDAEKEDIAYIIEASCDLQDWSNVIYDSRLESNPNNAGAFMEIEIERAPCATRFVRLRVEPVDTHSR